MVVRAAERHLVGPVAAVVLVQQEVLDSQMEPRQVSVVAMVATEQRRPFLVRQLPTLVVGVAQTKEVLVLQAPAALVAVEAALLGRQLLRQLLGLPTQVVEAGVDVV